MQGRPSSNSVAQEAGQASNTSLGSFTFTNESIHLFIQIASPMLQRMFELDAVSAKCAAHWDYLIERNKQFHKLQIQLNRMQALNKWMSDEFHNPRVSHEQKAKMVKAFLYISDASDKGLICTNLYIHSGIQDKNKNLVYAKDSPVDKVKAAITTYHNNISACKNIPWFDQDYANKLGQLYMQTWLPVYQRLANLEEKTYAWQAAIKAEFDALCDVLDEYDTWLEENNIEHDELASLSQDEQSKVMGLMDKIWSTALAGSVAPIVPAVISEIRPVFQSHGRESLQQMHEGVMKEIVAAERQRCQARIDASKREVAVSRQEIAASRQEIAASRQGVAASRQEIAASRQEIAASRQEIAANWREIEAKRQRIAELDKIAEAGRQRLAALQLEIDTIGRQRQNNAIKLAEIAEVRLNLQTEIAYCDRMKKEAEVSMTDNRKALQLTCDKFDASQGLPRGTGAQIASAMELAKTTCPEIFPEPIHTQESRNSRGRAAIR